MSQSMKQGAETKKVGNESAPRRVYISGFAYTHSLAVGVAYYYRGHYIYAYPQRNPIEPVPFSTKKGIRIVGISRDQAPTFNPNDPSLVHEGHVRALERSCFHERESRREKGERGRLEVMQQNTYTPHDRSQYLAYSAPGSRVGSVENLQQRSLVGPTSGSLIVSGLGESQDAALRPVASTSRLHQLLAEEETRPFNMRSESSAQQDEETIGIELPSNEAWMDPASMSAFIEAVSRPSSRPTSRPLSRLHSPVAQSTALDQDPDHTVHRPGLGRPHTAPGEELPSPTIYIPLSTTGRPRAASRALNQAYNAANISSSLMPPLPSTESMSRCPIQSEPCDGEFVTDAHATLRAQTSQGFGSQQVPMIRCADGRVMIDWVALRDEQMRILDGQEE